MIDKISAIIYHPGDKSIELNPWSFNMELPINGFENTEEREKTRVKIKELYEYLNVEWKLNVVFSDETI